MVISAILSIKGHKQENEGIHLISCDYSFSQSVDHKGLTSSKVRGGEINLSFVSIEDSEIIQWMISEEADRDGKILFVGDNNTKPFKTLEFKDARLISYTESFMDQSYMTTTLIISARQLILSGVKHTNAWLGYDGAGNGSSSS
ncbi:MAG: type VI secretion system tube protein TssD [Bacteroidales bacterium]